MLDNLFINYITTQATQHILTRFLGILFGKKLHTYIELQNINQVLEKFGVKSLVRMTDPLIVSKIN